jgi:heat shock protein HspQ
MAYRSDAGHCRNTTKACIKLYYLQNNQWVLIEEIDPKNSGSAESHNSLIGWLGPTKTSPPSLVVNGQGDNGGAIYVIEMALVESDVPVTSPSVEVLATHFSDPRVKVTSMNTNDARSPARLVDIEVVSKPTNAVVYRHTLPIDRVAQLKCITNKLTYGVRSRYHSASGTGPWSLETEFTASNPASAVIISTTICSERYDAMNETISVSCSDPVAQLASATLTVPTASPIVQAISCTVQDAELCCNATTATIFTQIDDNFGSGSWHTPVYQCVPLATGSA